MEGKNQKSEGLCDDSDPCATKGEMVSYGVTAAPFPAAPSRRAVGIRDCCIWLASLEFHETCSSQNMNLYEDVFVANFPATVS